jgi:hypothetical protein
MVQLNNMTRMPDSPMKAIGSQLEGFSIARELSPCLVNPNRPSAAKGGGTSFTEGRGRKTETAILIAEISDKAAKAIAGAMVDYLNTNKGQVAYLTATEEWLKKHGKGTPMKVTLANPFPLHSGSSPVGCSGCFTCRLYCQERLLEDI